MRIHHIKIERFRGIKSLDWYPSNDFACLVGPGDTTKTTILDAIDFTLSSRWDLQLEDTDFYGADPSEPISVDITLSPVPEPLRPESKFGLLIRGWSEMDGLHDEPGDGDEHALTVRFSVGSSLEPKWHVINNRNPEGKEIGTRDREHFGVTRLGALINKHLGWERRSALFRLTGTVDELPKIIAEANREARKLLGDKELAQFSNAARVVEDLAKKIGVNSRDRFRAALDLQQISFGQGGITLHDGDIPLRRAGLGTRRLLTLAIQREIAKKGGILLIDEFEYGLEPHRIRRLLNTLRDSLENGQAFTTTHSATVLIEQSYKSVHLVRCTHGDTKVLQASSALQPILRSNPDAFMARKVIVCEGRTEQGVCRGLDEWWHNERKMNSFGCLGVVPIDGRGNDAPNCAQAFAALGFDVSYIGDSDTPTDVDAMQKKGISTFVWNDGAAIEERISSDLPWDGIKDCLRLAVERTGGAESIRDSVATASGIQQNKLGTDIENWIDTVELRNGIGKAAKKSKWFKTIDAGEKLGEIIGRHLDSIADSDVGKKLASLREWIDRVNPSPTPS